MWHSYLIFSIYINLLIIQSSTCEVPNLAGDFDFQYYNVSILKSLGCFHTRRLLLLKANQSSQHFPSNFARITTSELIANPDNPLWLPKCRFDRPDLYEARQCNARDCFCVNVTTCQVFLGTWTSPDDIENCTTALFRVILFVSQNEQFAIEDVTVNDEKHASNIEISYWEPKIVKAIEKLCLSTVGYQRVAYINRIPISSIHDFHSPDGSSFSEDPGRLLKFELELFSTGHNGAIETTQELIQHRFEEGYLPGIGPVESTLSFIELLEPSLPDPAPVLSKQQNDGNSQFYKQNVPRFWKLLNDFDGDSDKISGLFLSHGEQTESLSGPMQLDGNVVDTDTAERESFHPISARQTAGDLTTQNIWRRKSISELFLQPGVIAGVVGSSLAALFLLILLILFCVYRLRKKDEGSYSLDEPNKSTSPSNTYVRAPSREFYA